MSNGVLQPKFTPTQQRIMDLLSDGHRHSRKEIHGCLPDGKSKLSSINIHIMDIRTQIRDTGYAIICELCGMKIHYRCIKLPNADTHPPKQMRPADYDER